MPAPTLTPRTRTRLRSGILELLERGKDSAITGAELARKLGEPNDRRIRMEIEDMICDHVVILSCERGYYLAQTNAEVDEYLTNLRSRATKIFTRISNIEHGTKRKGARCGQLPLI